VRERGHPVAANPGVVEVERSPQRVALGFGVGRSVADGLVERDGVGPVVRAAFLMPPPGAVGVTRASYCESSVMTILRRSSPSLVSECGRPEAMDQLGHAVAVDVTGGMPAVGGLVKVWFDLARDDDGWPPVGREGLWAVVVSPDVVRLDNTPWFALNVANGDLFQIRRGDDDLWLAGQRLQWSGNCTIRIIPFAEGAMGGSRQRVLDAFARLGVAGEGIERFGMVALDVPHEVDVVAVKQLLFNGQRDGWWEYEEGCVGDDWLDAEVG
jgi:hypothetical protein